MINDIEFAANIAEIMGGFAVVFGIIFALVEFMRYKSSERREAAASLARSFQTQELATTLRIMIELPESFDEVQFDALSEDRKNLIWNLFCSMESIGVLVSRGDLPIDIVDEFFSIPILVGWEKLEPYAQNIREANGPQAWEWYEWLYNHLKAHHASNPRIAAHLR